jgi:mono/diheme cytochrome c family protein
MGLRPRSGTIDRGHRGRILKHLMGSDLEIRVLTVAASILFALAPKQLAAQDVTPPMIARGDSIFHGKVAGATCMTCHQANAKGIPGLAPDLTDKTWLHGDGSLAAIVATIEKGVPKPKQAAAPMLPKGGVNLTSEQISAVAAYVYRLSHPQ